MKKLFILLAFMFATVFSANAQLATENSKFFDNTYVGVEVGATTPLSFDPMFPLNTVAGLKVGKELTPVFGFELEGQLFFNDNNVGRWTETFVKGSNLSVNAVTNLSNLFGRYKGTPRFFEVKANTGLGWLSRWNGGGNSLSAKTAVDFAFNVDKKRAHTITVTPGVWWDLTANNKVQFNKNLAQFGVFVGYTYHFKTSNGTHHFKVYDVGAMTNELVRLNEELAKKPKEVIVEKLVTKEVPVTAAVAKVETQADTYVFFAFDSDVLTDEAKATLDKVEGKVAIVAYASPEGSEKYNQKLSQRRADTVKAYLEGRNVTVVSAEGKGVNGDASGRVAIVSVK